MKQIDLNDLLSPVGLRYAEKLSYAPVFLTLPGCLPKLNWPDDSLERVIHALIDLSVADQAGMPVRMAVSSRLHWTDLEDLLKLQPSRWVQFRIKAQFLHLSENTIRELPEKFGFRPRSKWQKDSDCMLIGYDHEGDSSPAFFLWLQRHKASCTYSMLIPVLKPAVQV